MRQFLLSVVLAATAAAQEGGPTGTGFQMPQLRQLIAIGCDACGDARQFGSVLDVALGPDGQVLVVDATAPMIRLFDRNGRILWSGGRPGAGPGEYRLPIRARLLADGSIIVVDMTLQRITHLGPDRAVRQAVPIGRFASTATIARDGSVTIGSDNFAGKLTIARWRPGGALEEVGVLPLVPRAPDGTMTFPSIAGASDGSLAAITSSDYAILRLGPDLSPRATLARQVARVRRTAAEEEELQRRSAASGRQMASAERGQSRAAPAGPLPSSAVRPLKPHLSVDALRFDDRDRLWVRTMRGTLAQTVFDLFAPSGTFVGSLTLPHRVVAWTVGFGQLAALVEDDDGVPKLVVWELRQ